MADKEVTVKLGLDSKDYESKIAKAAQGTRGLHANWAQAASGVRDLGSMALMAAQKIGEFVKYAGRVDSVTSSFNSLAASAGKSGKSIIDAMTQATRGTVDTMKMMESASLAINLMGPEVVEKLPMLAEVAMAAARSTGKEVSELLGDVIVASGRQSVQILDNLGISSSTAAKYQDEYAQSLGKTREQLDNTQKSAAFFYAVEKAGGELVKKMNLDVLTLGEKLQILDTQATNAGISFSQGMNPGLSSFASLMIELGPGAANLGNILGKALGMTIIQIEIEIRKLMISFKEFQINYTALAQVLSGNYGNKNSQWAQNYRELTGEIERQQVAISRATNLMNNYDKATTRAASRATAKKPGEKSEELIKLEKEFAEKKKLLDEYNQYTLTWEEFVATRKVQSDQQGLAYYEQVCDAKTQFNRKFWQDTAMITNTASVFMAESNKGLFNFGKGLAITEAIINTYLSATKAMAQLGFPLGLIAAGVMTTAGLLQVAKIAQQQPPEPPSKQGTPKFEQGVVAVPHDTFAQIHAGESVIPKSFTESIRAGEMTLGANQNINVNLEMDGERVGHVMVKRLNQYGRRMGRNVYGPNEGVYN